jgi:hypothetical protein
MFHRFVAAIAVAEMNVIVAGHLNDSADLDPGPTVDIIDGTGGLLFASRYAR